MWLFHFSAFLRWFNRPGRTQGFRIDQIESKNMPGVIPIVSIIDVNLVFILMKHQKLGIVVNHLHLFYRFISCINSRCNSSSTYSLLCFFRIRTCRALPILELDSQLLLRTCSRYFLPVSVGTLNVENGHNMIYMKFDSINKVENHE